MNQVSSCAYNEGMLLIDPSEVHVWLSSPVLSGNTWLSELPADLRAELFRVNPELESVAVMCVKPSQAHAVDHVIEQIEQMKMMSEYGSDGVNFSSADSDQFDSDFTGSGDMYADDDFSTQQVCGESAVDQNRSDESDEPSIDKLAHSRVLQNNKNKTKKI